MRSYVERWNSKSHFHLLFVLWTFWKRSAIRRQMLLGGRHISVLDGRSRLGYTRGRTGCTYKVWPRWCSCRLSRWVYLWKSCQYGLLREFRVMCRSTECSFLAYSSRFSDHADMELAWRWICQSWPYLGWRKPFYGPCMNQWVSVTESAHQLSNQKCRLYSQKLRVLWSCRRWVYAANHIWF